MCSFQFEFRTSDQFEYFAPNLSVNICWIILDICYLVLKQNPMWP
jgi:hypothetical protein